MAHVRLTKHLNRFFPGLPEHHDIEGDTAAQIVAALDRGWPGLGDYIVDERGTLRKHVNIFINSDLISDRMSLSDPVGEGDNIHILQALSGG